MSEFRDYKSYVADAELARVYSDYQKKYADEPRESDKKTARLVLSALRGQTQPAHLLDIGCSTGNFLRHMKKLLPASRLVGGDLMAAAVDQCRADPSLTGIDFEVMDVFDIPQRGFDVVTANAVNVYFEQDEYERAVASIAGALRPGGTYVAYEWIFPGSHEQRVVETSQWNPNGLKFWFRSEAKTRIALQRAGFFDVEIIPFEIPIDLPEPILNGTESDLVTYTKRDPITQRRMMFRGALYQPWAHIVAHL